MSDLIFREALKKAIEQYQIQWNKNCETDIAKWDSCESILAIIDNAPTVEPDKVLVANVTFDEDKLKDIVQTEVIEKIKSGELVIKDERPQGEWIIHNSFDGWVECPFCHVGRTVFEKLPKFCENCGADMRGGAENDT